MEDFYKGNPSLFFAVSRVGDGNMSLNKGEREEVLENRRKFYESSGISEDSLVYGELEHGIAIKRVGLADTGRTFAADGLIANQRGINLFMVVADCPALAVYDPKRQAIGLFHASRHNFKKGIISQAIKSMTENFGSAADDLIVQFSPSIGPCCYQPFILKEEDKDLKKYLVSYNGVDSLDIWRWTETELTANGIINIHNPRVCTFCSNEYFSYKRFVDQELANDYRFAVVFGMK